MPAQIQKNVCTQREDRAYCKFQEYTEDTPENRLLKKALVFANRAIQGYKSFAGRLHPFWIDMPRLFELFVCGELNKNPKYRECVKFQVRG